MKALLKLLLGLALAPIALYAERNLLLYVTGKGNTFINDFLKMLLNATPIANIADNAASSPLTNLYLALATANPAATGDQTTSEAAYTSYARVAVARTTGGFTAASAQQSVLVAIASFPPATGGSETETYATLGTAVSGSGKLLYFGQVSPTLAVSNGVTPQLTTATSISET